MTYVQKIKRLMINILIRSRIRPFTKIGVLSGFFEYGVFIRKHKESRKFPDKFQMYDYMNELLRNEAISYLEYGVYRGQTILYWSALNTNPDSRFVGFDSFEGLPESWKGIGTVRARGFFDTNGEMPQTDDKRVSFVKGWFQDTLLPFLDQHGNELSNRRLVIHLDADLYSSELYCLSRLFRYVSEGTILIFDDFSVPTHDYRAFKDWTDSHLINYRVLSFTIPNYGQAAIEITSIRRGYS